LGAEAIELCPEATSLLLGGQCREFGHLHRQAAQNITVVHHFSSIRG
jgi:hypothetical protein